MKIANAIYGLFPNPDSAQRAVNALVRGGVERNSITVISSEPFQEYDFGLADERTPMAWLAALGGLVGGVSGYGLAVLTQKAYPIVTGGMPLVTQWSSGIVTYELTMLGAILTTLGVLMVSARLPGWGKKLYDPEVSNGKILIGVVNPAEESRNELESRMRKAGASEIKEYTRRRKEKPSAGSKGDPEK